MNPNPQQGEVWWSYQPWQSVENEIQFFKSAGYDYDRRWKHKSMKRPVYIVGKTALNALNKAVILPIGSSKYSNAEPNLQPIGAIGRMHGGAVRCVQLQSFPLVMGHPTVCEGGMILRKGDSVFQPPPENYQDYLPDILKHINDNLFPSAALKKVISMNAGNIINVVYDTNIVLPSIVLFEPTSVFVTIMGTMEFREEHRNKECFFIIEENEMNIRQPLSVRLTEVRTVHRSRCEPGILCTLKEERVNELLLRFKRLVFGSIEEE